MTDISYYDILKKRIVGNLSKVGEDMAREQLKTLTEPMYYILLCLTKENHGYGIMQQVEALTDGEVIIGAGTMYTLLARFEREGFIKATVEVERRKLYRITDAGRTLLDEETKRLQRMLRNRETIDAIAKGVNVSV